MDTNKIKALLGKEAIIDNNIICDLSELGCIELLNKIFSKVLIPKSIVDTEIIQFRDSLENIEYREAVIETIEGYSFMSKILTDHGGLTDCDAEVVTIAYEKYVLCTSNEKRIMTTCKENNIEFTGTLGILCCAYEHSIIDIQTLEMLINKLQYDCSCFLSNKILDKVRNNYKIKDRQ